MEFANLVKTGSGHVRPEIPSNLAKIGDHPSVNETISILISDSACPLSFWGMSHAEVSGLSQEPDSSRFVRFFS